MAFTLLFLSESIQLMCAEIAGLTFQSWISPEVEPWCSQAQSARKRGAHGAGAGVLLDMETFVYFTNTTQLQYFCIQKAK